MKVYYIYNAPPEAVGVMKKIDSQVKVFSQAGYNTQTINIYKEESKWLKGVKVLCPGLDVHNLRKEKSLWIIQKNVVYFRFVLFDFYFFKLLRALKQNGNSVIIEVPTYPFVKELNIGRKIQYVWHCVFSVWCKKYIDFIVTYSSHKKIFGVPTIPICNGIDTNKFPLKKKSVQANPVNLLVVAMVAKWHGIDRVINGLKLYYRNVPEKDVLLHIVGGGPAISALKKLVQINHLEDKVIFYGIVKGEQLDAVFDKADIGIASLGCHRIKIYTASVLKSREYGVRGLPFIISVNLPDYPSGFPYVKYFPADDSPIDIKEVVNFYNELQEHKNYSEQLRNWAKNNLSWTRKMQPVIEQIKQVHAF